jgi:hypothetical protein|tara:strand:- start:15 stop:311 length:297 start_codon:yes stop_codon:yes gene_type:complete
MREVTYANGTYDFCNSDILFVKELVDGVLVRAISYHTARNEVMMHHPAGEFRRADICPILRDSCFYDVLSDKISNHAPLGETNNVIFKALEGILRSEQ